MTLARDALTSLFRRFGLATLAMWILLLAVMSTLSYLLTRNVKGLDSDLLFAMSVAAMLVAWALGSTRWRPGWALAALAVAGMAVVLIRVGSLGGKLAALAGELVRMYWFVARDFSTIVPEVQPVAGLAGSLATDLATLLNRTQAWMAAMASGQPAFDPVAAALVWALVLWLVAAWAAWALRRWRNVLLSMLPVACLMAPTMIYTGEDPKTLLVPLGAALCLFVVAGQVGREERWRASGLDFWEGMRLDLALMAVPLTIGLLLLSSVVPSISIERITEWANRTFVQPVAEARPVVPESLGLQARPRPVRPPDNLLAPGLPRRHLIGASPDLSRDIVMMVSTNETPPVYDGMPVNAYEMEAVPTYYWRGSTYDRYTGSGWATRDTQATEYRAGEAALTGAVTATITATHRLVRESVSQAKDTGGLVYAAGMVLSVDQAYSVARRQSDDVFNVKIDTTIDDYQADVLIPNVPESRLRAAPSSYPKSITDRYLELPKDLPGRVTALARDLTATSPTPYDRARAIETYLRTFSYTLELPAPPPFRDIVDYFLFDLKQGYCDYFATSMVILARGAGLPARLVVGYASGNFDPRSGRYVVTEMDGHSWPEVYFPGIGWVEFEPTSSRGRIERPGEATPADLSATRAPQEALTARQERAEAQRLALLAAAGAAVVLGIAAWLLVDAWRLNHQPLKIVIARLYRRAARHSRQVAVPADPGDTPYEFEAQVTGWLHRASSTPAQDKANQATQAELNRLVGLYVDASYSPHPLEPGARAQAIAAWRAVRKALWLTWARRRLRRRARPASKAGLDQRR